MRTLLLVVTGLLSTGVLAQQPPLRTGVPDQQSQENQLRSLIQESQPSPSQELTRFDLDFPGGTPEALVEAIQKAMGRPLNAIVPDEYANFKLPALKMSNVNVQQLFMALEQVSRKSQAVEGGGYGPGLRNLQVVTTSYGFRQGPGSVSDDTIWCFYAEKPSLPPVVGPGENKICRFYSLTPYLEQEIATVDDITTAIDTGWKMLGETSPPKISFHKDTKLLIAVGEPSKLEIIDSALKALARPKPASAAAGQAPPVRPVDPANKAETSNPSVGQ
jgi:hypothetical protein